MGKKRAIDDAVNACKAARKQSDNSSKIIEKLLAGNLEKNKTKLEKEVKTGVEALDKLKQGVESLENLEDDGVKDFESKKSTELAACRTSSEKLLEALESVHSKEGIPESLKAAVSGTLGKSEDIKEGEDEEDIKTEPESSTAADDEAETDDDDEEEDELDESVVADGSRIAGVESLKSEPEPNLTSTVKFERKVSDTVTAEGSNWKPGRYKSVDDFSAERAGDLSIRAEEEITVTDTNGAWWQAVNSKGEKGSVPKNFLQKLPDPPEGDDEDEDEYEDSDEEEEEEEEVSEKVEQEVETQIARDSSPSKTSLKSWKGIQKNLVTKTSAADVLQALGACPAGFRASTTAKLLNQEKSKHTYTAALHPAISKSGFQMADLFWDEKAGRLKPRETRVLRSFRLMQARNIPMPGVGIEVMCRYVSIALFDGKKILSNIMTVKATWNENDPKTWRFSPKTTGLLPTLLDGFGFVRAPEYTYDLGLLIEFNIAYNRPKSSEEGVLSCGYVHLKLCSEYGASVSIPNKEMECTVNGGTPFEKGVPLDATLSAEQSGKLRALVSTSRLPVLNVKMGELTKYETRLAYNLPETIVMPVGALEAVSYYRQTLAEELVKPRIGKPTLKPIASPFLASFPIAMDSPDLVDLLKSEWIEAQKGMSRANKKEPEALRVAFRALFLHTVYPIMYCHDLPPYSLRDQHSQIERWRVMKDQLIGQYRKSSLALLTSSEIAHKPFFLEETTLDMLDPFVALHSHNIP